MATFIVVHGEKPHKDCKPHREFLHRLEKGITFIRTETVDGIVVSGGATRKNCVTEAAFGAAYLRDSNIHIPIFLEERSHDTIENIRFTKNILRDFSLERLIVISSKKRLFRLKYLYGRLWPDVCERIEFVGVNDSYGILFSFLEFVYFAYAIFDVHEYLLPRLTKKFFRNG